MLSRRNVRIKVMQLLYSMNRDPKLSNRDAKVRYQYNVQKSFELYLFAMFVFTKVTEYAVKDAEIKKGKLRPTPKDLSFTPKLFHNDLIQSIAKSYDIQMLFKKHQFEEGFDFDTTRSIYSEFSKTDDYIQYLGLEESSHQDHKSILLALFKCCTSHETFTDLMEDHYPFWVDDKSLVVGAIKKTIKVLPSQDNFFESYRPTSETIEEFGESLFDKVIQQDEELLAIIEPSLKNWDADRVAVIDMILLKMALCELISFPTIPTKVTLNEFVEISKLYSTDKSKDFINGILDRLMKKLNKEGKINKEGRGLLD